MAKKTSKAIVRRSHAWYGWVPDLPDQRDKLYQAPARMVAALPKSVDLRPGCPEVYDQGQLGSCTANAIGAALQFDQIKQKQADVFAPSRLFIYYNERVIENTVDEDSGAMIRDGIKARQKKVRRPRRCGRTTSRSSRPSRAPLRMPKGPSTQPSCTSASRRPCSR